MFLEHKFSTCGLWTTGTPWDPEKWSMRSQGKKCLSTLPDFCQASVPPWTNREGREWTASSHSWHWDVDCGRLVLVPSLVVCEGVLSWGTPPHRPSERVENGLPMAAANTACGPQQFQFLPQWSMCAWRLGTTVVEWGEMRCAVSVTSVLGSDISILPLPPVKLPILK